MSQVQHPSSWFWPISFFSIVLCYCWCYAPVGLNETDGGFLTGLAWQVLNGKVLYQDILYVRPPLPVWLRAMELQCLPEHFAILGERWIFYGTVALYSWLAARVLTRGNQRWPLATLGFVVSAHCYPPMAWHTVDGILFAVLAASVVPLRKPIWMLCAGFFLCLALLCKQSFYPLFPLFCLTFFWEKESRWEKLSWFLGGFGLVAGLWLAYLSRHDLLSNYLNMTSGAASAGAALQHGLLDYFFITPELALPSLVICGLVFWWTWKGKNPRLAMAAWLFWLLALMASYAAITWLRQEHTVPFAQSRALFWAAVAYFLWNVFTARRASFPAHRSFFLLLGISWCASVSWGYNLPILFSTPAVWAIMELTRALWQKQTAFKNPRLAHSAGIALLLALLVTFRVGYEFVYRDGKRSEMREPMGAISPKLSGIRSDSETAALYRDFKQLAERYGPNIKTLPAFPQSNFLSNTPPPLPLDWVVNRETNGDNQLIFKMLGENHPVIFVQKSFREKIETDPELEVTKAIFQHGKILEETPHFWVIADYEL